MSEETASEIHEAIKGYLDEDEIPVCWVVVVEVARSDGNHLIHRAGGGIDGMDPPMAWTALGMLDSAARIAGDQVADNTEDA